MMKRILAGSILGLAIGACPLHASATGGLSCSVDDANLAFDFEAVFSYSDIGGLFQVTGVLDAKSPQVHPTLRKFDLTSSDLKQQWFRDKILKLMIYRETEGDGVPFASVKLIVEATQPPDEDFAYEGKYRLTIEPATDSGESQAITVTGSIACSAG